MGVEIICGEAREVLAGLPAVSVHCAITSPPYFGLRSYGGGPLEIGTEGTPQEYVAHLVEVFAQVKRVLHPTATCWVVMGDSYCTRSAQRERGNRDVIANMEGKRDLPSWRESAAQGRVRYSSALKGQGLKDKDLIGVPWMLAFALRDDGWYLRQEVIWQKLSAMPESVGDRCTRSHETIFMLAKGPAYYYDPDAIREPQSPTSHGGRRGLLAGRKIAALPVPPSPRNTLGGRAAAYDAAGRNKRSVWTVGPQPLDEPHYAAFPQKLVEPMILAGTSEAGCCPRCLAPYRRVVERTPSPRDEPEPKKVANEAFFLGNRSAHKRGNVGLPNGTQLAAWQAQQAATALRWLPSCHCEAGPPIPCTTLDPFLGSGTTALVSKRLGRSCVGIELNPAYAEMARRRIESVPHTLFSAAILADDGAAAR